MHWPSWAKLVESSGPQHVLSLMVAVLQGGTKAGSDSYILKAVLQEFEKEMGSVRVAYVIQSIVKHGKFLGVDHSIWLVLSAILPRAALRYPGSLSTQKRTWRCRPRRGFTIPTISIAGIRSGTLQVDSWTRDLWFHSPRFPGDIQDIHTNDIESSQQLGLPFSRSCCPPAPSQWMPSGFLPPKGWPFCSWRPMKKCTFGTCRTKPQGAQRWGLREPWLVLVNTYTAAFASEIRLQTRTWAVEPCHYWQTAFNV